MSNPERKRALNREWMANYRATHREEYSEYYRNYYKTHRAQMDATSRRWGAEHPEKTKEYRRTAYLRRKAKEKKNGNGKDIS